MRYLNKVIFLNSAHIPYAEIRVDGNVHFIGTQGVGKSTLLRAILFFYNADKLHLGIPKEKQNFDAFYLPYANSYIVYEVVRENSAYSVVVSKSMGRAAFRLIDAPYRKAWFVNDRHEVSADWSEVRTRILESDARCTITPLVTSYEMFRDIIFGNNRKPDMVSYRKFAIVESSKYQNIPRTIQHVFLNSRLDADFVKDTIIQSMNEEDVSIDLTYYRSQIEAFEQEYDDVMRWLRPNKNGEIVVRKQAEQVIQRYRSLLYSQKQLEEGRAELNYAEKAAHDMLPDLRQPKGRISRMAPRKLALPLRSLRPILHIGVGEASDGAYLYTDIVSKTYLPDENQTFTINLGSHQYSYYYRIPLHVKANSNSYNYKCRK